MSDKYYVYCLECLDQGIEATYDIMDDEGILKMLEDNQRYTLNRLRATLNEVFNRNILAQRKQCLKEKNADLHQTFFLAETTMRAVHDEVEELIRAQEALITSRVAQIQQFRDPESRSKYCETLTISANYELEEITKMRDDYMAQIASHQPTE